MKYEEFTSMFTGKQSGVLVYGCKESYDEKEWIKRLKVVNMCEFAETYRDTYDDETDEEIYDDSYDVEDEDLKKLSVLLKVYGLSMCSEDTNFDKCYIGVIVNDYELMTEEKMKYVRDFCERFDLVKPTYLGKILYQHDLCMLNVNVNWDNIQMP